MAQPMTRLRLFCAWSGKLERGRPCPGLVPHSLVGGMRWSRGRGSRTTKSGGRVCRGFVSPAAPLPDGPPARLPVARNSTTAGSLGANGGSARLSARGETGARLYAAHPKVWWGEAGAELYVGRPTPRSSRAQVARRRGSGSRGAAAVRTRGVLRRARQPRHCDAALHPGGQTVLAGVAAWRAWASRPFRVDAAGGGGSSPSSSRWDGDIGLGGVD